MVLLQVTPQLQSLHKSFKINIVNRTDLHYLPHNSISTSSSFQIDWLGSFMCLQIYFRVYRFQELLLQHLNIKMFVYQYFVVGVFVNTIFYWECYKYYSTPIIPFVFCSDIEIVCNFMICCNGLIQSNVRKFTSHKQELCESP